MWIGVAFWILTREFTPCPLPCDTNGIDIFSRFILTFVSRTEATIHRHKIEHYNSNVAVDVNAASTCNLMQICWWLVKRRVADAKRPKQEIYYFFCEPFQLQLFFLPSFRRFLICLNWVELTSNFGHEKLYRWCCLAVVTHIAIAMRVCLREYVSVAAIIVA